VISEVKGHQLVRQGLVIFIDHHHSQFVRSVQNISNFLRRLCVNCSLRTAENIVSQSAFVNALFSWRKLNSWRKNTELFDNHNGAAERKTTEEIKTTSPDGCWMYQNHKVTRDTKKL
jgi:hypothetical protein